MATINGDRTDACALLTGGDNDEAFGNSFDRLRTRGAKSWQERRHEISPHRPPTCNQISNDRDVRDTIEAWCHAQAESWTH